MPIPSYLSFIEFAASEQPDLPAFRLLDTGGGNQSNDQDTTGTSKQDDEARLDWRVITYKTLWKDVLARSVGWRQALYGHSIQPGAVVTLWIQGMSYADVVLIYALSRAGYVPQMVSFWIPTPEAAWALARQSHAQAIICDPAKFDELRAYLAASTVRVPVFDLSSSKYDSGDDAGAVPLAMLELERDKDATAVIFHTSGSTSGMPKIVPWTYGWLDFALREKKYESAQGDGRAKPKQAVQTWFGSACHIAQFISQLHAFTLHSCVLQPPALAYSPAQLTEMINRGGVTTVTQFSPFFAPHIALARKDPVFLGMLKGLRTIALGGLPLGQDDEKFCVEEGLRVQSIFASTECGITLRTTPGKPLNWFVPMHDRLVFQPLLDDDETPGLAPHGSSADHSRKLFELVVLSSSGDCPVPAFRSPVDGHYHTGDMFEPVHDDSNTTYYRFRGRIDDWIKLSNLGRCDTKSIEKNVMETCKDIVQTCVVVGSQRPEFVLFVELLPSAASTIAPSPAISTSASSSPDTLQTRETILARLAPTQSKLWIHERLLNPEHIVVVPAGALPRTVGKGNVRRSAVEANFKEVLDVMFAHPTNSGSG